MGNCQRYFYIQFSKGIVLIIIDTEVYKDYFLLCVLELSTGKTRRFEMYEGKTFAVADVRNLMQRYTTVSFNGNNFDLPIIAAVLAGKSCAQLKDICDEIITSHVPGWQIYEKHGLDRSTLWDHIDIIDVAPGSGSLKIYGGRLHTHTLQDLPIAPESSISPDMRKQLRDYCVNDLVMTAALYEKLKPAIDLRAQMSKEYGMDLRSKSDAQIAETIIKFELNKRTNKTYRAPTLTDYSFVYKDPKIIKFTSKQLRDVYSRIRTDKFILGGSGSVVMLDWLRDEHIVIGTTEYRMGIGGLHSCEKSQYIAAGEDELLSDFDVASYYPNIILQQNLSPDSLGKPFLDVYQTILDRRIKAKRAGDKVTAETLKIAVNGSFGKLGSKYSALYAPDILIQTTITGQLALLMLIERFEIAGGRVVSANTDGVVVLYKKDLEQPIAQIAWDWMLDTSFQLEESRYRALASRDVNNYVAIKQDGSVKCKGVFAAGGLAKNPDCEIIYDAVAQYIAKGTAIETTIRACTDIKKFLVLRRVNGGGVWRGIYLGRAVRFYLSTSIPIDECIHYSTNSNRVPKSAGAMPLMVLPKNFPTDVDYESYICKAADLLVEIGYVGKKDRAGATLKGHSFAWDM